MARKRRIGTGLSDTNNKTIIVGVDWTQRDPVYRKSKRRITRFSASDINNTAKIGDRVVIEESKPISKTKKWRLIEILEKSINYNISGSEDSE